MNAKLGFLLAFVAGFADTATFVGARGIFSAHVTGNFVLFAVALIKGVHEIDYLKIFLFVPFLLAVALVGRLSRVNALAKNFEAYMLIVGGLFLFISGLYFYGVNTVPDKFFSIANVFIILPVIAMGIQNGLYKIIFPTEPMTTVMTGNAIQVVLETIGYSGIKSEPAQRKEKVATILRLIVGFSLGCLVAAIMVSRYSLAALIFPAVILFILGIFKIRKTTDLGKIQYDKL